MDSGRRDPARRRREESALRPPVEIEIVVPAYNETGRLPRTLEAMTAYLGGLPWPSRVVVVDNGSSDDTAGVVPTGRRSRRGAIEPPPEDETALARVLAEVLSRTTEPTERRIAEAELGAARLATTAPIAEPLEPPPPAAVVERGVGQAAVAEVAAAHGLADPAPVGRPTTLGSVEVVVIGCARAGKGAAVLRGLRTSSARFVGFTDSDLSTPLDTLEPAVAALRSGAAAAIASRHAPGSAFAEAQPLGRRLGGGVFRAAARSLVPGVHDTQCGFKFFDREQTRSAFWATRSTGFAFDVELLQRIHITGGRIVEIPVTWTDDPGSTLRTLDGVAAVAEVVKLRRRLPRTAEEARGGEGRRAGETAAEARRHAARRARTSEPGSAADRPDPAAPESRTDPSRRDGPRHRRTR